MENKGKACDPGWNDPPMFSYEARNAPASKSRTLLNKRVAFPIQAPLTSPWAQIVDPTAPLPPCSASHLPPPPLQLLTQSEDAVIASQVAEDAENFDSDGALELVMKVLSDYVKQLENKEKDKDDILRRLYVMKDMWINQKLTRDVQQKLLALSKALENSEEARADELQKGLMVDHPQLCGPWMSGIRQILRLRKESPPVSAATGDDAVMPPMPTLVDAVPLLPCAAPLLLSAADNTKDVCSDLARGGRIQEI